MTPKGLVPATSLREWVLAREGIVHRADAEAAGYPIVTQRAAVRKSELELIRRNWLAAPTAPGDLMTAARSGGRVTCVSAARRRGWWIPEDADDDVHVGMSPHAGATGMPVVAHWTRSVAPAPTRGLIASPEDTLLHVAACLPHESALVVWESAVRMERLSVDAIRRIAWPSLAARACAERVSGLSDSGLETIPVVRLSGWGVRIRQQAIVAGKRVDLLIGERLVVQIDGFGHHSTAAQRTRDVAADAELTLRGYTVLRFTYAQVIHDWPAVERVIARAIAAGCHRAP